jgi:glycosyltransferase involved in cell wall biosynthesis
VTEAFLLIERGLSRLSSAIVTISPRQRADITERFAVASPRQTHVIPLGFDLRRFDAVASHRGELRAELGVKNAPILSVVGRLTGIKDHPLLFRAFRKLRDLGTGAHLCVVGGGELLAELRALAGELGIADVVHFLGFRTDLERVLADTDVVALSSINEGTPVALIEALAAGCSVVGLEVGGVADVLEEGKWGRLVGQRTPEALAEALDATLREQSVRSPETQAAAKMYVRGKYGIDRLVNDHVTLYEALLARTVPNNSDPSRTYKH